MTIYGLLHDGFAIGNVEGPGEMHTNATIPLMYNDIVAPVASNPGRQQLRSATRSDVIVPCCRTKFGSRAFSIAGP